MKCVPITNGYISVPSVDHWRVRLIECRFELERRRHLYEFEDWYGGQMTCLTCGYSWGERAGTARRPTKMQLDESRDKARARLRSYRERGA